MELRLNDEEQNSSRRMDLADVVLAAMPADTSVLVRLRVSGRQACSTRSPPFHPMASVARRLQLNGTDAAGIKVEWLG